LWRLCIVGQSCTQSCSFNVQYKCRYVKELTKELTRICRNVQSYMIRVFLKMKIFSFNQKCVQLRKEQKRKWTKTLQTFQCEWDIRKTLLCTEDYEQKKVVRKLSTNLKWRKLKWRKTGFQKNQWRKVVKNLLRIPQTLLFCAVIQILGEIIGTNLI